MTNEDFDRAMAEATPCSPDHDRFEAWTYVVDGQTFWTAWCGCGHHFGDKYLTMYEAMDAAADHYPVVP